MVVASETYAGPLPPPDMLQAYGQVVPNLDARLVDWAEAESTHRREMAKAELELTRQVIADTRAETRIGQLIAALFGLGGLVVAAYAIQLGHPTAGTTIATGTVGALVAGGLFSLYKKSRREDRAAEAEEAAVARRAERR